MRRYARFTIKNEPKSNVAEFHNTFNNYIDYSSIKEILSINEDKNIIEVNYKNNYNKKAIYIKDYLEYMSKNNNKPINEDICKIHNNNNKYISYCFDCDKHLCKECLINKSHVNHFKNNIFEIQPDQSELDIIKEIIEDYKIKIDN